MKEKPLISFLIALYNKEKYVIECIESCLNQTYKNIEVCIVDDGSSDKSLTIIKKLYSDNEKVKIYYFKKNRGKVSAYNKAYEISSGNYFALVGADDVNLKNRLYILYEHLKNTGSNLVYGKLIKTDANLNHIGNLESISSKISVKKIIINNFIAGGSSLFDRKIATSIFPLDKNMQYEDWWLSLVSILKFNVSYIDKNIGLYRLNESNDNLISTKNILSVVENNKKLYKRDFHIYQKILEFVKDNDINYDKYEIFKYIEISKVYKTNYIESKFSKRMSNLLKTKYIILDYFYVELLFTTIFGNKFDVFKKIIKKFRWLG